MTRESSTEGEVSGAGQVTRARSTEQHLKHHTIEVSFPCICHSLRP